MQSFNRRHFLQAGALGACAVTTARPMAFPGLGLSGFGGQALGAGVEPHFFLLVSVPLGMDSTYLFDGRPLAMTQANLVANYLKEEPTPWTGSNGQATLATKLTAPLAAYKQDFSVLNGVVMAAGFDGHDQNMNYLLTGNPFGGDSFVPQLNQARGALAEPLDFVQAGDPLFAALTNIGSSMPVSTASVQALTERLKVAPKIASQDRLFAFLKQRMAANGAGDGAFAAASRRMAAAAEHAPTLDVSLRALAGAQAGTSQISLNVATVSQFFKSGIAPAAVIVVTPVDGKNQPTSPDTHAGTDAADSAAIVGSIASQVADVFKALKETPYDSKRSMFDVTTVVMATEFSRTMRQTGMTMELTGTDHNPLNNSVLIGGKGIKGGMVINESDFRTATETLSGAHLAQDGERLKVMGRPFDFKASAPRKDLPAAYDANDYLLFASVANTVYSLFGVPKTYQWVTERNGPTAPVLSGLLA